MIYSGLEPYQCLFASICRGGSRISVGEGALVRGAKHIIFNKLSEKLHQIDKILVHGGGGQHTSATKSSAGVTPEVSRRDHTTTSNCH